MGRALSVSAADICLRGAYYVSFQKRLKIKYGFKGWVAELWFARGISAQADMMICKLFISMTNKEQGKAL